MTFADSATRLSGLTGLLFGWSPDTFWAATPSDLAARVRAAAGEAADPADTALTARLMETFPDG